MHKRMLVALSVQAMAMFTAAGAWPPPGERVKAPVVRDTWISAYKGEMDCNMGGADKMKTKGIQEFSIVDIDPVPLRGRVVTGATLHLHCRSKDAQPRLTVSSLATDWVEGTSKGYAKQAGSASFNWAAQDKTPWAWPGSDMSDVMNGMGNTIWRFADTTPPDAKGWQVVAVDPDVVAARVAGISYGFVFFDDVGSEYDRNGEEFRYRIFPNRFVSSREAGAARAPYLTLYLGDRDTSPPKAVGTVSSSFADLAADSVRLRWATPTDSGPAGVIGFHVRVSAGAMFDWDAANPIPRHLIPMAGKAGETVVMDLSRSDLPGGRSVTCGIRAIDRAGNVGPVKTVQLQLSSTERSLALPAAKVKPFAGTATLPRIGNADVWIADMLDKVTPDTGKTIPARPREYRSANHLWSAKERRVRLFAARNEFVAFQIVLSGSVSGLKPSLRFTGDVPVPFAELRKFRFVKGKNGLMPDPLVPIEVSASVPDPDSGVADQQHASFVAEIYVPHRTQPGTRRGTLRLTTGEETLDLAVDLTVWDFTLPNRLSFIPQMNAYSRVPEPQSERDYYRMAHLHRTCLNILTYSWNGSISDNRAPHWNGQGFDWANYDRRFGPLLDGSAFADLPRGAVPIEAFYLPFNENWPLNIHKAFLGGYWIEEAMAPDYRPRFIAACRQFAEHVRDRGWDETMFEFYLNNKVYHKAEKNNVGRWSRSAAPWVFDEPVNTQDFWALRWYGTAFQEAVAGVRDSIKMLYRCDISRPQWQRDTLDDILDVNVCGGAFHRHERVVLGRKRQFGEVTYNYGAANKPDTSNVQPAAWCIDTWCRGLDGVLPWQTLGRDKSWKEADQLSLFYPGKAIGRPGPHPSVRLKSFRRGQQDVEYLTLLAQSTGRRWGRDAVSALVLDTLQLKPGFSQAYAEDAGIISFHDLDPADLWELRVRVGTVLNKLKPEPSDRLVEFRPPVRDLRALPDLGYARVAPDRPRPAATAGGTALSADDKAVTIQGKPAVRDAVICYSQPDKAFGRTPRDNRLLRQMETNAMLLRFDLSSVPAKADVKEAMLSIFVWDPSNNGKTRLCAYPVTAGPWDENAVTWGQRWKGRGWQGNAFAVGADTPDKPVAEVIVAPDAGGDIANPPVEYKLDITEAVKVWLSGRSPNHGIALCPIADREVDDGHWSRFQVLCSEHGTKKHTPKLVVRFGK